MDSLPCVGDAKHLLELPYFFKQIQPTNEIQYSINLSNLHP